MKLKNLLLLFGLLTGIIPAIANPVTVKMNSVSRTMTLQNMSTEEMVNLPTPTNYEYQLDLTPGDYLLTAYASDQTTINGTIVLNVTDSLSTQVRSIITCTAYVSNKHSSDNSSWNIENNDYTLDVKVNTREGSVIKQTQGKSTTMGRYTFLAFNGNSYNVAFVPSEEHWAEGYMTLYRGGTLTANVNVTGAIPLGGDFSITVPLDAELELGMKFTHFTDFTAIKADKVENTGSEKTYKYTLANGQVYNYRTWKPGGLTHAGYFTMNTDQSQCPVISFSGSDYAKADPKAVNHSSQSNNGYETGDLLLNINPQHHLRLDAGDKFLVHGMRMWELTDNSTNNYFFEPDLHYTVLDVNFQPSNSVIEIDNANTTTSAWSTIKAKGTGTAIVLVTYDGINLNYYNKTEKREYLGGEYWGAIWPENTGVFVVTVGEADSSVIPNMTVNEEYNMDALRLAGNNVDAEHDVFYYLDNEEGFYFTFKPEGVASLELASPIVTESEMKYTGFSNNGVVKNEDGSYTILLKEGKTIVKMTDSSGKSAYQVLRAKPCHREITNQTRPGSKIFQPGDKVKIQYSGLFHPANKIAGIYNMSAYVTYNGVPNGSSLILGSGQYTFGSAASAQAVTVEIPDTLDVLVNPFLLMNEGVIQVNGYGDPIGNHRNTSPTAGRSPNFTAVPHKTYFGSIPDIRIDLNPIKYFNISLSGVPANAEVSLTFNEEDLMADDDGVYTGTFGTYSIVANAEGHKCFRRSYAIGDDSEDNVVFAVEMQLLGNAWDGKTKTEPQTNDAGVYQISNGAELAWFADKVNAGDGAANAELLDDIELGNFAWSPIGSSSSKSFTGTFNGNGHSISEIYVNDKSNYKGLFGYVNNADISGLTILGTVSGKQYVGGLAGYVAGNSTIDRCANYSIVNGSGTYVGGLVGYLNSATATLTNCYNAGDVSGTTNCGGLVGCNNASATMANIFNVGSVTGSTVGACVGGTTAKNNLTNAFAIVEYQITAGQTLVSEEQMASGEVAYLLGQAFAQTIGVDMHPVFYGLKVYKDEENGAYYNYATSFKIDLGDGNDNVIVKEDNITMPVKEDYQLMVIATPSLARLPEIVWSSSDDKIVTVDESGMINAVSKGEATIKASGVIGDETFDSTCKIIVIGASANSLTINSKDDITLHLEDSPTVILTASYGPEYADEPEVIWTSSDETVATVEHEGKLHATVTASKQGNTTITIFHVKNPEVYDSCKIFVTSASSIENIILGSNETINVYDISGRTVKLNATLAELRALPNGLYIIKVGRKEHKVLISF